MRRARSLLLVFVGGAFGSLLRVGALALPFGLAEPFTMLVVNVLGAFLLGVLLSAVHNASARLLLGTGLLGGFTSYSAMILLATPSASGQSAWVGLGLAALTVVAGVVAAGLGLRVGAGLHAGQKNAAQDPAVRANDGANA